MSANARLSGIAIGLLLLLVASIAAGTASNVGHTHRGGTSDEAGLIWDSTPATSAT